MRRSPMNPLDPQRYTRWVQASHRRAQVEAFMVPTVQGLGRLDENLVASRRGGIAPTASDEEAITQSIWLIQTSSPLPTSGVSVPTR